MVAGDESQKSTKGRRKLQRHNVERMAAVF